MYTVRRLQYTTFGVMPLRRLQYFVEGSHVKILLNKDVERASNGWMDVCLRSVSSFSVTGSTEKKHASMHARHVKTGNDET